MKKEFIPRIVRGEIEFGLGYTEPEAGSDLANMKMTAVDQGDYFLVNGQKTFNTESHYSDYHWLAAKTDLKVSPYKGISLFIVDQRSPRDHDPAHDHHVGRADQRGLLRRR